MAQPADLIITHARAITMDPAQPRAEALAVRAGRIAYIGTNTEALGLRGRQTRLVDAAGRTLLPGLIDSHYHLLWGSLTLDDIRFEGVGSYSEMANVVRGYAAAHPTKPWLAGYGLAYNMLPDHGSLTRQHLDAIIADRPLIVVAFDLHTAWANTKALELANLLHGAVCAPGNEIVLAADGTASGELREPGAYNLVTSLIPAPDVAQMRGLLQKGLAQAARYGITSIHNMDGDAEQMALYQDLERRGELTLRISIPLLATPETPSAALAEALAMRDSQSALVTSNRVKCFLDGVIESYTALLLEAYADRQDTTGAAIFTAEQFTQLATEADRLGLQVTVHAIGDGAVRRTLDGFAYAQQANGRRDSRHRIEHIEVLDLADLRRFSDLGVIASMQPVHAVISTPGQVWAARVGQQRWARSFPWQTLRASGAQLAFGSDWPVVSQNPFLGMQAALTRQPWADGQPDQAQSLSDTLAAYTVAGAYAELQEAHKGQLCVGMLADLAVLSGDIEATPPDQMPDMTAVLTICNGRVVYENGA